MFDLLFGKIKTILSGKEYEFRESSSEETFARQYDFVLLCNYDGNRKIHAFLKDVMSLFDFIIVIDYSDENFLLEPILKEKPFLHIKFKSILDNRELLRLGTILDVEWICLMNANEKFDYRFNKISNYKGRKDIEAVSFSYVQTFDGKYYYVFPESREGVFEEVRMWRKDVIHNEKGECVITKGPILFYSEIVDRNLISEKVNLFASSYDKQGLYFKNYCFRNYEELLDEELERVVGNKLSVIGEYFLSKQSKIEDVGLYSGDSGVALFLAHYYLWSNDSRYLNKLNEYLDYLGNLIEKGAYAKASGSFCSGIAGYCWLLCYLKELDLIDFSEDYFDGLDDILQLHIKHLKDTCYLDQMHGLISIGRYFLKRNKVAELEKILKFINECAEYDDGEIKWRSVGKADGDIRYNFSLAHGMAGILYFITKCYQQNILPELCLILGKGIINFYIHNEQNFDEVGSFYPNKISVNDYKSSNTTDRCSRLAWCYGDMGILNVIYLYAKSVSDKELEKDVLNKFLKETDRKDCWITSNYDAQFCHGSAGLVQIYSRLYFVSGNKVFRDAALYWLKVTIEMGKDPNIVTGYRFFVEIADGIQKWDTDDRLLCGVSGVAMAFLSVLQPNISNWDEAMMIS